MKTKKIYEPSVNLNNLTDEQINSVPNEGDILIYNEVCKDGNHGIYRRAVEKRGCCQIVDVRHPIFLRAVKFISPGVTRPICLYRSDFYAGLMIYKKVEIPYYSGNYEWAMLDVANFN